MREHVRARRAGAYIQVAQRLDVESGANSFFVSF